jgi:hypothetical protein
LPDVLVAAAVSAAGGEQGDAMAKKSRRRTSGRKRSATVDMATRRADQAKGGAGAVAGILWAAMHNNDFAKPMVGAKP